MRQSQKRPDRFPQDRRSPSWGYDPDGRKYLQKLERRHGKGKALTILAHKLARAVYFMLKRKTVFDMKTFLDR